MMGALRFGIAGLVRGSHFLPALNAWGDTKVAAVCDPDAARIAQVPDFRLM